MKVGVFAVLLSDLPFEEALDYIKAAGCDAVEIGTGAYPGGAHCPLDELVGDKAKAQAWAKKVTDRGLTISALSCHGNPIHPDAAIAKEHDAIFRKTIDLAGMLGIETVVNFSGCPGDAPGAKYPNWVTCPWPPDFGDILDYQWNTVAIPYWKEINGILKAKNVRVGLEMHPGFIVYNTETALRLRLACGEQIGVNFDPSHLFWQGMDPVYSLRKLGDAGAIFHFHAKDCKIDEINTKTNGVLDTKNYAPDEIKRSWIFRTIGYGHDTQIWKDMVSTLRLIGYDGALSIEHEDSLMSSREGLAKAIAFLKDVVISEQAGPAYWA